MPALADHAVQALFKQHFGFRPAHVARAPAKVELLGSHVEACEGLVLTAAVDRYAFVAVSPRTDGRIELVHADRAPERFWITELRAQPAAPWADAFKAMLRELRQRKVHFSGFNVAVHSDIPAGLGMGEEAAGVVAALLAVRKLFPFGLGDSGATLPPRRNERGELPPLPALERMHFARVVQAALASLGTDRGGFMDAATSLAGRQWNVLSLDCRFRSIEPAPFVGTAVIVCDSGARMAPASFAVEVQTHGRSAADKLRAKTLRSVEPKLLRAARPQLTEREFACASHITGEIQRVAAAERAVREEDHRQLGNYLSLSHESLRDTLQASGPELDALVALARAHAGCFGARAMGLGLGGATVNLVAYHAAEPFMTYLAKAYEARTGRRTHPVVCQIVDGAA